jgi:hypothetical protein
VLAKQVYHCLGHISGPFWSGYFGDGGLTNYLLPISASQVAKITGVNHQCQAIDLFLSFFFFLLQVLGTQLRQKEGRLTRKLESHIAVCPGTRTAALNTLCLPLLLASSSTEPGYSAGARPPTAPGFQKLSLSP